MSHRNAKPAEGTAGKAGGKAIKGNTRYLDSIIETSPRQAIPKRRRLDPRIGALKRLDAIEGRLAAARAAGDEIAFGRYYLSWCRLHSLAFGYGRFAKGGADG